jgi:tetratricopeptide (TPR) repeat protein
LAWAVAELVPAGSPATRLGTAFAVSREWALTAFHCIGDLRTGTVRHQEVVLRFAERDVCADPFDDGDVVADVALLRLRDSLPAEISPLALTDLTAAHDAFTAPGFPSAVQGVDGMAASGRVVVPNARLASGARALQLYCEQAAADLSLHGLSGAPVLVGDPQLAAGVIRWNPPRTDDDTLAAGATVYACASRTVIERWPHLGGVVRRPGLNPPLRELPSREKIRPSDLIRAEYAVVPFRGCEGDLAELEHWCTDRNAAAVRLMVSPGGTGKTRVAIELCRRMAARGWMTGFLDSRAPIAHGRWDAAVLPALVVVDDAQTRGDLQAVLAHVARESADVNLRVLLLARAVGDWWGFLLADDTPEVEQALRSVAVRRLGEADDTLHDPSVQGIDPPPSGFRPLLDSRLTTTTLLVHMAAVEAVGTRDDPGRDRPLAGWQPLKEMLEREVRFWRRSAKASTLGEMDPVLMKRAVAVATLVGASDEDEAAALLTRVPDLRDATEGQRRKLARWLHGLDARDPDGVEWLGQVQPDVLEDELVAQALRGSGALAIGLLRDAAPPRGRRALTILTRAAQERAGVRDVLAAVLRSDLQRLAPIAVEVAIQTGDPLGRILADVIYRAPADPALLKALADVLPERSVSLQQAALVVNERRAQEGDDLPKAARRLHEISVRLAEMGRLEEALDFIEEAVGVYRRLAEARPDAFLPDLAMSLHSLSKRLGDLDRPREALAAVKEASRIYRQLAQVRPDAFLHDLADVGGSLKTQSARLLALGRLEEALDFIEEAVGVYRRLAEARPDVFLPEFSLYLMRWSHFLSAEGRPQAALTTIEEAVSVYRALVEAHPDASLHSLHLAMSLNNRGVNLRNLGRHEEALVAHREAATLFRRLRAHDSIPDWVPTEIAVNNLIMDLHLLGYGDEEARQEAERLIAPP